MEGSLIIGNTWLLLPGSNVVKPAARITIFINELSNNNWRTNLKGLKGTIKPFSSDQWSKTLILVPFNRTMFWIQLNNFMKQLKWCFRQLFPAGMNQSSPSAALVTAVSEWGGAWCPAVIAAMLHDTPVWAPVTRCCVETLQGATAVCSNRGLQLKSALTMHSHSSALPGHQLPAALQQSPASAAPLQAYDCRSAVATALDNQQQPSPATLCFLGITALLINIKGF